MRFSSNSSTNQYPKRAAAFGAAFAVLTLVLVGTQCSSLIPKQRALREVAVGRALTARFAKSEGILQNAQATSYISLVGESVAQAAGSSGNEFHFAILNTDKEISAAGPGGYILISKGYLKKLNSEAELAAVLAREIAHVALAHYSDSVLTSGSVIETSEEGSEELYEMIMNGDRPTQQVADADAAAAFYLYSVGYDPNAVVAILDRGIPQKNAASDRKAMLQKVISENGLTGSQTNQARFKSSLRGI